MLRGLMFVVGLAFAIAAAAAPPPIEAYGRLPATEFAALSPSGQRVALVGTRDNARVLILRNADGAPISKSPLGATKIRSLAWAGDDHLILFYSDEMLRIESRNALIMNLSTRKTVSVEWGIRRYLGSRKLQDHWIGYFDVGENNGALVPIDLDSGEHHVLAPGAGSVLDTEGGIAAHAEYAMPSRRWRLFAGVEGNNGILDQGTVLLSADDPNQEYALLGLGRKPGTVLVQRPARDGGTLWEFPLDGKTPPVSLTKDPDFNILHGADGLAVALGFDDRDGEVQFFDPAIDKKAKLIARGFAPNQAVIVSWSDDFNRFIVRSAGPDDPGSYYLVDLPTQHVDLLGQQYPGIGAGQVGPSRMVPYKAADGLALEGVLTLPPGPEVKARPLVVLPHGGPGSRDHVGFDWMAQAFAARGYAVFQPNFRGSTGYGKAFLSAGDGQWGRKMLSDIADGAAELVRLGIADPKRACIVGASYGGYAALAGVTVQTGLYRCAVSIGGVTDLRDMLDWLAARQGSAFGDAVADLQRLLGVDGFMDSSLRTYSPAKQAARADAPILLIYGRDDTVVPTSQSETMAKALQDAGKPVQTVVLAQEDHWLSREATRQQMLKEAIAFVEKNNPP